jgi:flagellar biosynthesis/type III secretory pathway protein FliH
MQALTLESFDRAGIDTSDANCTYKAGYDAGLADGKAVSANSQSALSAEVVQSISDLQFNYAEARSEITNSLGPLFAAITAKILPQCVSQGLALQIARLLQSAAAEGVGTPLSIAVHPKQRRAVEAALVDQTSLTSVIEDHELSENAALLRHEDGEISIDLDAVLHEIRQILDTIQSPNQENENFG